MDEKLGLRLRFALFFVALAVGGSGIVALGLWLGYSRADDGIQEALMIAGLVSLFGIVGLAVWVGYLFDMNVARPILALSAELHTRAKSEVSVDIDKGTARYLGALAPAAQAIHEALEDTRESLESALAEKLAVMTRDKALLEALLRELKDAVLVVSADGRILMYNRAAVALLGPLGLDRPLSQVVPTEPVMSAVAHLETAPHWDKTAHAGFLTAAKRDGRILAGAVSNVSFSEDRIGHVLMFRDRTDDLRVHGELEHLLRQMIEAVRRPASAIAAMLDVVEQVPDMQGDRRSEIRDAMRSELSRLSNAIETASEGEARAYRAMWPIRDVSVGQIFKAMDLHLPEAVSSRDEGEVVTCDGFAITEVLSNVVHSMMAEAGRSNPRMYAEAQDNEVLLCIAWDGKQVPIAELEQWLDHPIAPAYGRYTGRDALVAHKTDMWVENAEDGPRIVLPLKNGTASGQDAPDLPFEFYDFNLTAKIDAELEDRPLRDVPYIVFDTETTGLDTNRDEVVQISAVRILGGRLLGGENFDQLVNPGRAIPKASEEIHGISDQMVSDAPPFSEVADHFKTYCDGSVLVAHHAAFDMAFLGRLKAAGGPAIDNAALCTARLSLQLFPHEADHTLDGLAKRFGIQIPSEKRHTALGDSIATAEVLLKMLPLLEERGVTTLRDALEFQNLVL